MPPEFRPGDVVRCRPGYVADSLGLAEARGILVDVRGGSGKVLYPAEDRRFWVPLEALALLRPETVPPGDLLRPLRAVLGPLGPEEAEVEFREGGLVVVRALVFEVSHATLDGIRAALGDAFVRFTLLPEGMAVLAAEFVYRRPAA